MVKATKDNRPFSSGVFDLEEFNIYTKVIDLPLDGIPTYLEEGINGVCTGGSALFNVFSNKRRVVKNDLITIFPYQLASITEISTDFAVIFFKVPKKLFMDTINGLGRLTLDYFFYMRKYYSSIYVFLPPTYFCIYATLSCVPCFTPYSHYLSNRNWNLIISFFRNQNSNRS